MSFIDTLKGLMGKGKEAASQHSEQVHGAVDKAAGFANDKTGGKYGDQIGKAADAAKKGVGGEGQPPEGQQPPPPPAQ